MINFNVPKVENYETGITNQFFNIYKQLAVDNSYKIDMDIFEDIDKATTIIKEYLDRGAIIFSHFTNDYSQFVIFRSASTDTYIKEVKEEKNGKER